MLSYQDRLVKWLTDKSVTDDGKMRGAGLSNSQVRDFSQTLKDIGIIDMSKPDNAKMLIEDGTGRQILAQLVSWYTLGLLGNIRNIIKIIKEK